MEIVYLLSLHACAYFMPVCTYFVCLHLCFNIIQVRIILSQREEVGENNASRPCNFGFQTVHLFGNRYLLSLIGTLFLFFPFYRKFSCLINRLTFLDGNHLSQPAVSSYLAAINQVWVHLWVFGSYRRSNENRREVENYRRRKQEETILTISQTIWSASWIFTTGKLVGLKLNRGLCLFANCQTKNPLRECFEWIIENPGNSSNLLSCQNWKQSF